MMITPAKPHAVRRELPTHDAIRQQARNIQHDWSDQERFRRRLLASMRLLRLELQLL